LQQNCVASLICRTPPLWQGMKSVSCIMLIDLAMMLAAAQQLVLRVSPKGYIGSSTHSKIQQQAHLATLSTLLLAWQCCRPSFLDFHTLSRILTLTGPAQSCQHCHARQLHQHMSAHSHYPRVGCGIPHPSGGCAGGRHVRLGTLLGQRHHQTRPAVRAAARELGAVDGKPVGGRLLPALRAHLRLLAGRVAAD
jgi:hypothetical protein